MIKSDWFLKINLILIGFVDLKDVILERKCGLGLVFSIDIILSESGFDECEVGLLFEDDCYGIVLVLVYEDSIENGFFSDVIVCRNWYRWSGLWCVIFYDLICYFVGSLCERDLLCSWLLVFSESMMYVMVEVYRLGLWI